MTPPQAVATVLLAAALLHGVIVLLRRAGWLTPEWTRKLVHMVSGTLALWFPSLFTSDAPVLALAGITVALMLFVRLTPAGRRLESSYGFGASRRLEGWGEVYLPVAIALLWLGANGRVALYTVPLGAITYGDAAAALVGKTYGRAKYRTPAGETKSWEGSGAFLLVAWIVALIGLGETGIAGWPAAFIGLAVATVMAAAEAVSIRGLDNLFAPAAGWAVLAYLLR